MKKHGPVDLILRQPKLRLRPAPGGLGHVVTAAFFGATWCGDQAIVANTSEPYSHCTAGLLPSKPNKQAAAAAAAFRGGNNNNNNNNSHGPDYGDGTDDPMDPDPWPGHMGAQTYNGLDLGFTLAVPLHVPEDFPPPPY